MPDEPAALSARPILRERIVASVPLFLLFVLLTSLCVVAPRFEQMFKEMNLGELPALTRILLFLVNTLVHFWYLAFAAAAGALWIFFSWGCQNRSRMWWQAAFVAVAAAVVFALCIVGLFAPLLQVRPPRRD